MPRTDFGRWIAAAAFAAALVAARREVSARGDGVPGDPMARLEAWAALARERGEPTDWTEVVGVVPPAAENGAVVVEDVPEDALLGLPYPSQYPASWRDEERTRLSKRLEAFGGWFARVRQALARPRFVPALTPEPSGIPKPYGLQNAWRLIRLRGDLETARTVESATWLLRAALAWRPRTWGEARMWCVPVEGALSLLRRAAHEPGASPGPEGGREAAALLAAVEPAYLRSRRAPTLGSRYYHLHAAREFLAGRDPFEAQRRLPETFRKINEERPEGSPEIRVTFPPVPDYRGKPEELVQDTLALFAVYDEALAATGNLREMRKTVLDRTRPPLRHPAGPEFGDFERVLTLVAELRVARLGWGLVVDRPGGVPSDADLAARVGRIGFEDPLAQREFLPTRGANIVEVASEQAADWFMPPEPDGGNLLQWRVAYRPAPSPPVAPSAAR